MSVYKSIFYSKKNTRSNLGQIVIIHPLSSWNSTFSIFTLQTHTTILDLTLRCQNSNATSNYFHPICELVRRPKLNVCSHFPYYFAHHLLELGLFHWHLNRQTKFMCLFVHTLCINFCANCYSYVFSVFFALMQFHKIKVCWQL